MIAEIDHHAVRSADDVKRLVEHHHAGTPTLFLVHRNGGSLFLAVTS